MSVSVRVLLVTAVVLAIAAPVALAGTQPQTLGERAAAAALAESGTPYRFGGASPRDGFDSSGLVRWAFAKAGHLQLPHAAFALRSLGRPVTRNELRRGDLVFFDHNVQVGIYVGRGVFVHIALTGNVVGTDSLLQHRFVRRYTGAVRLTN